MEKHILKYLLCLLFLPTIALAQDRYETQQLFRKGAWNVELTYDTYDQDLWCSAQTDNSQGQTFALTAYQSDQFTIFIFDHRWDIAPRPIDFIVDVDYSRWTMSGSGEGIGISITPEDPDNALKFLTELMQGNAVAVMNTNERRLATFSLNGSYAAIINLMDCWEKISLDDSSKTDPFGSKDDPF